MNLFNMRLSTATVIIFLILIISEAKGDFKDIKFEKDFLNAHNAYRRKHGAGKLEYDPKLNRVAQAWAETLARRDKLQHSVGTNYGENIFRSYSSDPKAQVKGQEPVYSWYSELENYDFNSGLSKGGVIGHFTQVVWIDSKKLGVGVAKSSSNKVYVVANYSPPGNVYGQYKKNVHKAIVSDL